MSSAPASVPPPPLEPAHPGAPGAVRGDEEHPPWRPYTAVLALLVGFGGALFGGTVVALVGAIFGASLSNPPPSVAIGGTVVQDVCLVGAALFFAARYGRPTPAQFGLRPARFWPSLGWAGLAFAAFYAFTAAWVGLLGTNPGNEELPKELGVDRGPVALVAVAILVAVVAPLAEEFFFRGYMYGALRNWSRWGAAIVTGLVFGLIHGLSAPWEFLLPLAMFGFVLCLLREKTGSLYPGIALHCANNSIAFGVSQHWGWQIGVLFLAAAMAIWLVAIAVRVRWPSPATAAAG
ncbi:MAG: CPBP family intramembrane glutamic endopeptidase [Solirubrobacteraceae bacterium]